MALLRDAGAALHRAKENGADSWALVDDETRRRAVDRFDIEHQLRSGLARGELRLHLQPIVDVTDAHVVGREALVRWQHPERGLLGPAWFLPVAEESGLIEDLGRWVLTEAARIAAATPDLGYVAVNVSPSQVRRPGLSQDVEGILRRTGLDPSHLVIELTESVMLGAATEGRRQLGELDHLGVRLVVDDFGTGFSALSHLRDLPVSGIKVDRSFTSGLGRDPQCDRIVEALTGLAQGLGVDIVAEGVETEDQRAVLAGIGCEHAQGFLFGRPEPVLLP
jgi:EAL domain-containing protein (putative c-di-GMP-specific phosphodiesterase class I)